MKQRAGLNTPFPFEFVGEGHLVGGTERGVRTLGILVMDPAGKVRASMADCKEQRLVEQFVAHAIIRVLDEPVLRRVAWRDGMPLDANTARPGTAVGVSSVP